jgi:hypothetical protein
VLSSAAFSTVLAASLSDSSGISCAGSFLKYVSLDSKHCKSLRDVYSFPSAFYVLFRTPAISLDCEMKARPEINRQLPSPRLKHKATEMKKRLIFLLLATLLLTPWPVAYAYDNTTAEQTPVQIEAAKPAAAPHWKAFGKAIGGIIPGDLFYIDAFNNTTDMLVTLHMANTDELVRYYRHLIFKIGVYIQTDTEQWEKATKGNDELLPDTYITMLNGRVSFSLPGYAKYKITIDKGSFYCYGTSTDKSAISPTFYMTVG